MPVHNRHFILGIIWYNIVIFGLILSVETSCCGGGKQRDKFSAALNTALAVQVV